MLAVLGGLADVERDLIRTRTAEGRSRATPNLPEGKEGDQCDSEDDPHEKHSAQTSAADNGNALADRFSPEYSHEHSFHDVEDQKQNRESDCSSAKTFGGSGMPSGVSSVARRSAALRRVGLKLRMPIRARPEAP
jgi:hypothetical protein